MNDSKGNINENKDRHQHIGLGSIGKEGLMEFLKNKDFQNIPIIMETPNDGIRGDKENMKVVLEFIEDQGMNWIYQEKYRTLVSMDNIYG